MATRRKGRFVVGPLPEESLFGRWLRRRRKALDLTQSRLAQRVGCSASTIRKLEADSRHPSRQLAVKLAEILDIAIDERSAFVKFAVQGWSGQPSSPTGSRADRPWLLGRTDPTSAWQIAALRPDAAAGREVANVARQANGDDRSDFRLFGRSAELAELERRMATALQGQGNIVLVVGEAGQGKTALLRALVARALASSPSVLAVAGSCNAYTGLGDPFLPFREILGELINARQSGEDPLPFDRMRMERLQRFGPTARKILEDAGPNLFGAILDGRRNPSRITKVGAAHEPSDGYPQPSEIMWPGSSPPTGRQAAIRSEVVRCLQLVSDETPLILVLDDLQWIDRSSAELLMYLAGRLQSHRLLVVGAFRPPATTGSKAGDADQFVHGLLWELGGLKGVPVIDLDGADGRSFVEELLDAQPNDLGTEFREALWRRTAGHPLFTTELLRAMRERGDLVQDGAGGWSASADLHWDQLPDRVAAAIEARIAGVGAIAREVLRASSVMGETFIAEVVATVVQRAASDVVSVLDNELVRVHRLVEPVAVERGPAGLVSRYRFRHILIQQHVYEEVGDGARGYLHEAVAAAIEATVPENSEPLELAWHWKAAQLPARAVPYLRLAGERARRAGAVTEAIQHFTAALEQGGSMLAPPTRAKLLRDLGECYHWRTERPAALQALEEARALFIESGDVRSAGAVEATMGHVFWEQRDVARAVEVIEAAIASLEAGPETPELSQALVMMAMIHHVYSRETHALSHAQRALDVATRVGSEEAQMRALIWVGAVLASTDPARHDEGLAMIEEAMATAERRGAVRWVSLAANQMGARLRALGRFEEAVERLELAINYAKKHSLPLTERWAVSELWSHRWQRGEWDLAIAQLPRLQRYVEGGGTFEMLGASVVVTLARAYLDLGLIQEAQAILETHAEALEKVDEPQVRVPYLRECLRIAALQGNGVLADQHAFHMIEGLAGQNTHSEEVPVPVATVCHWLAGRSSREATEGLRQCLITLAQTEAQFASELTHATHLEGRAAVAGGAGRSAEAANLFTAAAARWKTCGFPLDEARALASAAPWLQTTGATDGAEASRRQSDGILREMQNRLPTPELRTSFHSVRASMVRGRYW